jgi:hypothetical protein
MPINFGRKPCRRYMLAWNNALGTYQKVKLSTCRKDGGDRRHDLLTWNNYLTLDLCLCGFTPDSIKISKDKKKY